MCHVLPFERDLNLVKRVCVYVCTYVLVKECCQLLVISVQRKMTHSESNIKILICVTPCIFFIRY